MSLSERYGISAGEQVTDIEWMRDAGEAGDAVLMRDAAILRIPDERRVFLEAGLRAFIVHASLPAEEVIRRFIANLAAIERACRKPGPFVYRLHPERIERRQIRL